jgi:hypothetical protein
MKSFMKHPCRVRLAGRRSQGYTLVEMLMSATLTVSVIVMGTLAVHLMGLREDKLLESKAGASDSTRRNISQFRNDIYGAKGWQIGNWNGSTFNSITNGANMQGNALMIYPLILIANQVIDSSKFVLYYFDTNNAANFDGHMVYTNSSTGSNQIIVSNLIAPLFFTIENYQGLTQTVTTYKSVIHATFNFSQFQYPLTQVGSNCLFNNYKIDVRATPHLPDGP